MNMLTATQKLTKGAQPLFPQPWRGLLVFHPLKSEHLIRHLHDLPQSVIRALENGMLDHDLAPRQLPSFYHGLLVKADRRELWGDQLLYRPPSSQQHTVGIVGVPHGNRQVVLALYTCGQLFEKIDNLVRSHPGSMYDVIKVTSH